MVRRLIAKCKNLSEDPRYIMPVPRRALCESRVNLKAGKLIRTMRNSKCWTVTTAARLKHRLEALSGVRERAGTAPHPRLFSETAAR